MDQLLSSILALPNGARFYRVDLHNHTPFDSAFASQCDDFETLRDDERRAFARRYATFARYGVEIRQDASKPRLDIIGVTEHNDVCWLPFLQEAANEVGLVVFPGVEVSAAAGNQTVHFLAIFDPDTEAHLIDEWLSAVGLTKAKRFYKGQCCAVPDVQADQLIEQIHKARSIVGVQAIPIAAHATSGNGLFVALGGEARVRAYTSPYLLAIEIPKGLDELDQFQLQVARGEKEDYGRKRVACLNHSDGRGLSEVKKGRQVVGERFTYMKLGDLSVEALRQAFIDFDSRIRLMGDHHQEHYPRLLGVIIERGFLVSRQQEGIGPFMLHFNPNLNTLIGGRGAGKSALLEAIRYCFDLKPRTDATRAQAREIVNATLPAGARVTVYYELADGARYRITRLKGHDPEVFDVTSGEKRGVLPCQILPQVEPVEIYGQKEIYEISNDVGFQLNLLDTYVADELREIQAQEGDLLRWLEGNGGDILRLQDEIADATQRVQELGAVRLELERMERHQAAAQLERKKQADREKDLLARAGQAVDEAVQAVQAWAKDWEPLRERLPTDIAREELPHAALLEAQAALLARIDRESSKALKAIVQRIRDIWAEGAPGRDEWKQKYAEVEQSYQDLLDELGQDFSAERYFSLRTRLQNLEATQQEIQRRQDRLEELRVEREQQLRRLRRLWRLHQYHTRWIKAVELTAQLKDTVRVAVVYEGNREAYAAYLRELFAGRRISQPVVEQLVEARLPTLPGRSDPGRLYANPMHLARAIRFERGQPADDESILAQVYGISSAYRQRLVGVEDEVLHKLEQYRVPDRPEISLKVGKDYRPLKPRPGEHGLSTGQKCTVILSLILVERHAPLIIDQPEDDLDNEFVYREVVQTLRREKEQRQFIVATHNANIPVAGDAELIVALQADEDHGWIEHLGSIDDPDMRKPVEDILEGGKEAFEFRQKKYQRLE